MTPSQKLRLEQSEIRQKINAALSNDELTDEERSELDGFIHQYSGDYNHSSECRGRSECTG